MLPGAIDLIGATVVDATSRRPPAPSPGASQVHKNFIDYQLYFSRPSSNWNLVGLPDGGLRDAQGGSGTARTSGVIPADSWSARTQEIRDAAWSGHANRGTGWEMWSDANFGGERFDQSRRSTSRFRRARSA